MNTKPKILLPTPYVPAKLLTDILESILNDESDEELARKKKILFDAQLKAADASKYLGLTGNSLN